MFLKVLKDMVLKVSSEKAELQPCLLPDKKEFENLVRFLMKGQVSK